VSSIGQARSWLDGHAADLVLLHLASAELHHRELPRHLAEIRQRLPLVGLAPGNELLALDVVGRTAAESVAPDPSGAGQVPEAVRRALAWGDRERRLLAAEEARRASEERYRMLFDYNPMPTWVFDTQTLAFLAVNEAATRTYGYSREEFLHMTLKDIRPPEDVAQLLAFLAHRPPVEQAHAGTWRHRRKDGSLFEVEIVTHAVTFAGRAARLVVAHDVTERKELERGILEISEREQRRIGQDLHDGLGQHLAGLELMSQVLEQNLAGKHKKEALRAREIGRHVRAAISQTRSLARGLSPVALESEGLMSALADLAANTEQMFHLVCRFCCNPPVLVHDHAVATHLYRIAQEAVSNAIKHGKARTITIGLRQSPGRVELEIHDDGVGWAGEPAQGKGMGLRIMRYRADRVGGSLGVGPRPKGGTAVTCTLPNPSSRTLGQLP
jgi:two-component system CheB/CheR fusion protein